MRRLASKLMDAYRGSRENCRWLDTPAGCCVCGTGGPYYQGWKPRLTRYVYIDACGPAGTTPDWSACSRHPLTKAIPIIDYGRDVVVSFRTVIDDTLAITSPVRGE